MFIQRRTPHQIAMILCVILTVSVLGISAWAQSGFELKPGQELKRGEVITNGEYSLKLQDDGNLVLSTQNGQPLWSSWTQGLGAVRMVMQVEGNLALYDAANRQIWLSQTAAKAPNTRDLAPAHRNARLALDQNGNLRIIAPDGQVLWHPMGSNILANPSEMKPGDLIQNGKYTLIFLSNGELALYQVAEQWQLRWSSKTDGKGGARVSMQADGNLVIYTAGQEVIWNSQTEGHPGAEVRITDQGTVQIVQDNNVIWENGNKK